MAGSLYTFIIFKHKCKFLKIFSKMLKIVMFCILFLNLSLSKFSQVNLNIYFPPLYLYCAPWTLTPLPPGVNNRKNNKLYLCAEIILYYYHFLSRNTFQCRPKIHSSLPFLNFKPAFRLV